MIMNKVNHSNENENENSKKNTFLTRLLNLREDSYCLEEQLAANWR